MKLYVGTSGFSYPKWKGHFYPDKLKNAEMLTYYGSQLPAVEINNTFYRLPKKEAMQAWASLVPEHFRFSVKASRRITHFKRLKEAEEPLGFMLDSAAELKDRLGVVLFQLPPNFRRDDERLAAFLGALPKATPAAFEFRHDSWLEDDVYALLREHNAALVVADTDDKPATLTATADFGYLRLRGTEYDKQALKKWVKEVQATDWRHAFVFFKHEDEGAGPRMAREFLELAG